jgi:Cu/Ag efflux protein CusF
MKRIFSRTRTAALALLLATSTTAFAQDMTEGEVRKVDKDAGKLTLKHGEIKNLDMPGMTMVFSVKDKRMLDMLKAGDQVRFKAAKEGGKYIVVEISAAS